MNNDEYKELASRLQTTADITRLSKDMNMNRELLLIVYTQRVVRDATKRYYRVKNRADRLEWQWKNGTQLLQLANRENFPPILLSLILMRHIGYTRKEYWKFVKNPDKIGNPRLRREIADVVRNDIIYSPAGMDVQYERGVKGESRLADWLDRNNISYRREDELKGEFKKTPDFLLDEPLIIDEVEISWIESKANFGDVLEIRKNMKKQLIPYTELFGNGIVVYWFGYVVDYEPVNGVRVEDSSFFTKDISHYSG